MDAQPLCLYASFQLLLGYVSYSQLALEHTTYEEKLREVGLISLEESRKREDMIQVWKILHGPDHVDKNKLFAQPMYLAKMKDKPEYPVIL